MKIACSSYDEAIAEAIRLKDGEGFEFFRGQSNDWPIISPSLLRSSEKVEIEKAESALAEFMEWAKATPQMISYNQNEPVLTAIAQHYGLPTRFLDLSYDPVAASIFSKPEEDSDGLSVIYCFKRKEIEGIPGIDLLEFDVGNLWRLYAQSGLFLEFGADPSSVDLRSLAVSISYPTEAVSDAETAAIYPVRKSHLETILDQYFFRNNIVKLQDIFSESSHIAMIRRHTYPGIFKGRSIPDFKPEWIGEDPRWIMAPLQGYIDGGRSRAFLISSQELDGSVETTVANLIDRLRAEVGDLINEHEQIDFELRRDNDADETCSKVLNRVWDGLRAHPYSTKSLELAIARTIAGVHRRSAPDIESDWEDELWQDVQHLDACPVNGHLDGGKVNKESFTDALAFPEADQFHEFYRDMASSEPEKILNLLIEPWVIYDFRKLTRLFCEELIPSIASYFVESCVNENDGQMGELWGASFNPALLAFVCPSDYRLYSPMALERNSEKLILVSQGMTRSDLAAFFCDALQIVLDDHSPFIVRLPDFSLDPREIWEIPEAIELCRSILAISGISVLEVFEEKRPQESNGTLGVPSGLSAFHIWMIGKDKFAELNGQPIAKEVLDSFKTDLMASNLELEKACLASS